MNFRKLATRIFVNAFKNILKTSEIVKCISSVKSASNRGEDISKFAQVQQKVVQTHVRKTVTFRNSVPHHSDLCSCAHPPGEGPSLQAGEGGGGRLPGPQHPPGRRGRQSCGLLQPLLGLGPPSSQDHLPQSMCMLVQ